MPIEFACGCGKRFKAKDGSEGRVFRCPACGADLVVPPAQEASTLVIETAPRERIRLYTRPGRTRAGRIAMDALEVARRVLGAIGFFFACLIGLGLVVVLVRSWEVNHRPERAGLLAGLDADASPAPVPAPGPPDAVDVAERERMLARAEADRYEAEVRAEAREARLRKASKAVLSLPRSPTGNGLTLLRSEELASGRWGVVAKENPFTRREDGEDVDYPGEYEYYLVEGGAAYLVSQDRFAWEDLSAAELAVMWAERHRDDGMYRARSATKTDFPAVLEAVVVNQQTGRRYRLVAEDATTTASAKVKMTPIDE